MACAVLVTAGALWLAAGVGALAGGFVMAALAVGARADEREENARRTRG